MYRIICLYCCLFTALPACAFSVTFINPGKSDEVYWLTASRAMEAAASDLDIRLNVLYSERQHPRSVALARQIIALPPAQRPDYVIFSNDYATGPELLRLFNSAGIKSFMAFSAREKPVDHAGIGTPRQQYPLWLGSLEPRAEDAGYLTAKALIARGRAAHLARSGGKLQLLAISGDRSTPSSLARSEGMHRAVAEAGDVQLLQEVYASWEQARAAEQGRWLYLRYPQAHLVWAGNDLMAFGAMDAWRAQGGTPGKNGFFSGINTSEQALAALGDGTLSALAGGHFIAGAWALVLLYDYHHGRDFADEGLELARPMFTLFDTRSAARFNQRYHDLDFSRVDFRRYSKVLNPQLSRYNFDFKQLLQ